MREKVSHKGYKAPIKQRQRINPVSDKQAKLNKAYSLLRKTFLEHYPICMAQWEGCTYYATTVHHPQGRIGERMLDDSQFKALCYHCHHRVETEPERAKQAGLSKSRLTKE